MTTRIADAMRRGALSTGLGGRPDVDLMSVAWFELADRTVESLRAEFHMPAKSAAAVEAGSVTPWEPGGISSAQWAMGQRLAESEGRPYDSFGASVALP